MNWVRNAANNLLPLSQDQSNFALALKEWHYTGNTFDLEEPIESCELCEHPDIRYQFEIVNLHTRNTLLVGSECIHKFEISAINESGTLLDHEGSRRKVERDRRTLISDALKRRVIHALVQLATLDSDFKIESFIDYFQDRQAFTPNQLAMLLWRLDKHRVQYKPTDFPMIIRRGREKDQLLDMPDWKLQHIWPCMSATQRQFYIEQNGAAPTGLRG